MDAVEFVGWLGAALTLSVYTMRTMLPLRMLGVFANITFISYGYLEDIPPTLFLHLVLLPINLGRLIEILRTLRKVEKARSGDVALDWLDKLATTRTFGAGANVFRIGDAADKIYYLKSGLVRIEEISREIDQGDIFGEVAFFTDERLRTASAICQTECEILEIDEKTFMRVYYQSPAFSVFVTRLLAKRLADATLQVDQYRQPA